MSEDGWRAFLTGEGVEDWVILHGGPTAVFRLASLQDAAAFAAAVAQVPGLGPRTILTVTSDRVTVKLTREMWGTEKEHLEVARAVSAVAAEYGAIADTSAVQEIQIAIAAKPDAIDLPFWRAVLGYAPLHEDNCIDPLGQGSTVWMQNLDPSKPCATPCMSTSRSPGTRSRRVSSPPWPPGDASCMPRMRRALGSWPTGRATESAWRHDRMAHSPSTPRGRHDVSARDQAADL